MNLKRFLSIHGLSGIWLGWIVYSSHKYIAAGNTDGLMSNLYILSAFCLAYFVLNIMVDMSTKRFQDFIEDKHQNLIVYRNSVQRAVDSFSGMIEGKDWHEDLLCHQLFLRDSIITTGLVAKATPFEVDREFDGILLVKRKSTPIEDVLASINDMKML